MKRPDPHYRLEELTWLHGKTRDAYVQAQHAAPCCVATSCAWVEVLGLYATSTAANGGEQKGARSWTSSSG